MNSIPLHAFYEMICRRNMQKIRQAFIVSIYFTDTVHLTPSNSHPLEFKLFQVNNFYYFCLFIRNAYISNNIQIINQLHNICHSYPSAICTPASATARF